MQDWLRTRSIASSALPEEHFAVEASAGLVSRAFGIAEVSPAVPGLDSAMLSMIGRSLIRRGESLWLIEVDPQSGVSLIPASSYDLDGGDRPASWRYRLDLQGPSRLRTVRRGYEEVLHVRINADAARPWKGQAPWTAAKLSVNVLAQLEKSLSLETKITPARIVPYPYHDQEQVTNLRDGLEHGGYLTVATAQGGMDAPYPSSSLEPRSIGPEPSDALVRLRQQMVSELFGCCGCPQELFGLEGGEGNSAREALRRWLHSTLLPWGDVVSQELSRKLDRQISLSFDRLMAGDIASRARSYMQLVSAGMDLAKAAALTGLLVQDD